MAHESMLHFMLRRDTSEMLTAVCILMCQMHQMVPVPVVGQMAAVAVETARCVVSKTMTTVTTVTTMATVASAMPTVASTSHSQGNRSQR